MMESMPSQSAQIRNSEFGFYLVLLMMDGRGCRILSKASGGPFRHPRFITADDASSSSRITPAISGCQARLAHLTEDSEGGLWIGTESQGVLRLKPKTVWTATSEDGLPHNKVWSIGEGQDVLIWLGTENGLARLSGGRMTSHSSQEGMTKNAVRVVARDKAGRIWFGTKNTLACVEGGQVRQFRFPGEWFNTKVNALWAGSGDVLWVGTVKGLYRVDASALPVQSSAEPGFYTLPMPLISRFLRQDFTPTCGRWLRMVMAPSGVPFHEWAWLASAKG